jgi:hypothetical protein
MGGNKLMSPEELHFLGIKAVYKDLIDKGYEVLNVRREMDVNPQLLVRQKGKWLFVVIRTAVFPRMGVLTPDLAARVLFHARKQKADCYFASVGVANALGDTEEEMAKPVVGGEYYINYKGLMPFPQ